MKTVDYGIFISKRIIYRHRVSTFDDIIANSIEEHSHKLCELLFIKQGDISYYVNERKFNLKNNSLIITRTNNKHCIKFHNKTYERYNILFDESHLSKNIFEIISENTDVINFEGNNLVQSLFKKIDFYCENLTGKTLERMIRNIIEEILCNIYISKKKLYIENSLMRNILEYIECNLEKHIDLELLSREFFISKSYLHKQFIKYLQVSPKRYIISKRLERAQCAIRIGGKPTKIYTEYGFTDYSAFYREYRNYFGIAPSEKRLNNIVSEILS